MRGSGARIKGYTGREVLVRVDYILETEIIEALTGNNDARENAFVIMSVSQVHMMNTDE